MTNKMIQKFLTTFCIALTVALSGCITDESTLGLEDPRDDAAINIATRGASDPTDPDNQIGTIRVISFKQDGSVRTNEVYSGVELLGSTIKHTIPIGIYDFTFIANEPAALSSSLNGLTAKTGLNSLSIVAADITSGKIPMIQQFEDVQVLTENMVQNSAINGGVATNLWPLSLIRLAARIDISLYSETDLSAAFTGVKLTSLPDRVPLVATGYNGTTVARTGEKTITTAGNPGNFADLTTEQMTALKAKLSLAANPAWSKRVMRLIVPFNEFTPVTTEANAITMTLLLQNQVSPSATMGLDDAGTAAKDYTLPRNSYIDATGEVSSPLELNISVNPWTPVTTDGSVTGNRILNVSEIETPIVLNNYQGTWQVSFYSDQPNVTLDTTGKWISAEGETAGTNFNVADYWNVTDFAYNASTGLGTVTFKVKDILEAPGGLVQQQVVLRAGNDAVTGGEDLTRTLTLSTRYLVYAPPGVVGITKSGKLTLKGSSTYSTNATVKKIATDDFGGLESEPVYVTYYKWGSTIATIGGEGDTFDSQDIVWAPGGYNGTAATTNPYALSQPAIDKIRSEVNAGANATAQWNIIPYGDRDGAGTTPQVWPATNTAAGLGDPCAYADPGTVTKWHIPSGGPWRNPWRNGEVQYPFSTTNPNTWDGSGVLAEWTTGVPSGPISYGAMTDDGSMFMPTSGNRGEDGTIFNQGSTGYYWSDTPLGSANYNRGTRLVFDSSTVYPEGSNTYSFGCAVRCVKSNGLVHAAPGVVGITDRNQTLSIAGSNIYAGRTEPFVTASPFGAIANEPVYVLYYKWGSTVGFISEIAGINGETGKFDAHDVVSNPDGVDASTYASFLPATPVGTIGTGNNLPAADASKGWGDICARLGNFKTPTGNPYMGNNGTPLGTVSIGTIPPTPSWWQPDITSSPGYAGGFLSPDKTIFLPTTGNWTSQASGNIVTGGSITAINLRQYGFYWSSTAQSSSSSNVTGYGGQFGLYIAGNQFSIDPFEYANAHYGYNVRCVPK
jgi:hypothetical protein